MVHSFSRLVLSFTTVIVLLSVVAHAQVPTGSVTGVLRDGSGGVLPGVIVVLIDEATAAEQTAVTSSDGSYEFTTAGAWRVHRSRDAARVR